MIKFLLLVVVVLFGSGRTCIAESYKDEFLSFDYPSGYSIVVKVDQPQLRVLVLKGEKPVVVLTQRKTPADHAEARKGMVQVASNRYKALSISVTPSMSPQRVTREQTLVGERLSLSDGSVTQDFYSTQVGQRPLIISVQGAEDASRQDAIDLFFKTVQFHRK